MRAGGRAAALAAGAAVSIGAFPVTQLSWADGGHAAATLVSSSDSVSYATVGWSAAAGGAAGAAATTLVVLRRRRAQP